MLKFTPTPLLIVLGKSHNLCNLLIKDYSQKHAMTWSELCSICCCDPFIAHSAIQKSNYISFVCVVTEFW